MKKNTTDKVYDLFEEFQKGDTTLNQLLKRFREIIIAEPKDLECNCDEEDIPTVRVDERGGVFLNKEQYSSIISKIGYLEKEIDDLVEEIVLKK